MARRASMVVVALASTVALAGCPQPNDEGCGTPSDELTAVITGALPSEGETRNFRSFQPSGESTVFISVEHRTADEVEDDDSGEIYTFATDDGSPGAIVAVDERARDDTDLPAASFDVRQDGAIDSRGCTFNARDRDG
jgi:hypothetical protein